MALSFSLLLLSLSAATVLLSPPSRAADDALIDRICRQTRGYKFCFDSLSTDKRSVYADIHGLCAISISNSQAQAQEALDRINAIETGLTDPVDRERIGICKADYGAAVGEFLAAFGSATGRRDYDDVTNKVIDGANKAIDCEDVYRRSEPVRPAPVSEDNHKVVDLVEITLIIVEIIRTG